MKKIIALLILLTLMFGVVPVYANEGDNPSDWAKFDISYAIDKGLVPTWLQGNYQKPITRKEFSELFVTAIISNINRNVSYPVPAVDDWDFDVLSVSNILSKVRVNKSFKDTDSDYVLVAYAMGIVNGVSEDAFNPNGLITREQAAIMFANYFQTMTYDNYTGEPIAKYLSDIDESSTWARIAVERAFRSNLMNGVSEPEIINGEIVTKGRFDTKGNLTREQAIVVITRTIELSGGLQQEELLLRGYLPVSMDALMSGFEVDANNIKMLRSGFNSEYSNIKEAIRYSNGNILSPFMNRNSEDLTALYLVPYSSKINLQESDIEDILNGEQVVIDYGTFEVKFDSGKYLAEYTKKSSDFMITNYYSRNKLYYWVDGELIRVSGERVK